MLHEMDYMLVWSGRRWDRRALPSEPWHGARLLSDHIQPPTEEQLEAAAEAMRPRPGVLAVLAPAVQEYTWCSFLGDLCYIMDRAEAEGLEATHMARAWRLSPWGGRACGSEGWLWCSLSRGDWLSTLHHEVWHTVRPLVRTADPAAETFLEAYSERVRAENAAAEPGAQRGSEWLSRYDEPVAWAYEQWITGGEPPHGVEPCWRMRRVFGRVAAGRYANAA